MVAYCIICKKGGGEEDNVSFHRLPKNEETKANWFAFIGYKTGPYVEICSKHFQESDFIYKIYGNGVRRFLKRGVYPTISQPLQSNKENIETFDKNDCTSTVRSDTISTITLNANIKLEDENSVKIGNVIMDEAAPIVNSLIPSNRSTIHNDTTSDIILSTNIKLEDEESIKIENIIIDEASMVNTSLNGSVIHDDTTSDILNTNIKLEDEEFIKIENVIIDEEAPIVNTSLNSFKKTDDPQRKKRRSKYRRFIGDICREDFTSDASWFMFHRYLINSRNKFKSYEKVIARLNKKVNTLQGMIYDLKEKEFICSDNKTCHTSDSEKASSKKKERKKHLTTQ